MEVQRKEDIGVAYVLEKTWEHPRKSELEKLQNLRKC